MNKIAVIYHANCDDGFGAAWAAWKKFGKKADYFAVAPRRLPEQPLDSYREIYVLDSSFTADVSEKLKEAGQRVIIIDHHKSSLSDIKTASEYVFDEKHSGAVLAWKYFHPKIKVPKFLLYVEAADLWTSKLPKWEEIRAYLGMVNFNFQEFSRLAKVFETVRGRQRAVAEGLVILKYKEVRIKEAADKAYHVEFMGHIVLAVNSSLLVSDIGDLLARHHPPFAIIWSEHGNIRRFSLRSHGQMDVSKLAAKFPRGGGHPNAAGFSLPASEPFPWKLVKHHHHAK
jgi:nanoRNase/pAp phosphatase (c-di-AMP/oligoRNAs hydrolase)